MVSKSSSSTLLLLIISINLLIFFTSVPASDAQIVYIGIGSEKMAYSFAASFGILARGPTPASNQVGDSAAASGTCSGVVPDIRACQSQGVKVFLSLTGISSIAPLGVLSSPQLLSDFLWNTFLGGNSISRPFGDVVFDGISFDVQLDGPAGYTVDQLYTFYSDVTVALKSRTTSSSSSSQKPLYFAAVVPCSQFPTAAHHLGSLVDYVWVRFYNNPQCEYNGNTADALLAAWNQWTSATLNYVSSTARVFLGLPAAPGAASSGYIPPNVLTSAVLPFVKTSPNYGGVMLWDTFYDQQTGYTSAIKNSV